MAIHHQVEIKNVLCQSQKQLSMKETFHGVYSNTQGAARPSKLQKAWKRMLKNKQIMRTPSKKYQLA